MRALVLACAFAVGAVQLRGDEVLFHEPFSSRLQDGWSWLREDPSAWKVDSGALLIRIQPGNMWGPANDSRNVLLRELPHARTPLEVSVTVSNRPTEQYEQVDLVCYFDDSHMVKVGFELVDGKRCIVMGREEGDRTRTIAIVPFDGSVVTLRWIVDGGAVRGSFREPGSRDWREVGNCELPSRTPPKVSIQCYQGPASGARWARISNLKIRALDK